MAEVLRFPVSVYFSFPSGFAVAAKSGRAAALEEAAGKLGFARNC